MANKKDAGLVRAIESSGYRVYKIQPINQTKESEVRKKWKNLIPKSVNEYWKVKAF